MYKLCEKIYGKWSLVTVAGEAECIRIEAEIRKDGRETKIIWVGGER